MFQIKVLNPEQKEVEEIEKINQFFKMKCKVQGKCCNLI